LRHAPETISSRCHFLVTAQGTLQAQTAPSGQQTGPTSAKARAVPAANTAASAPAVAQVTHARDGEFRRENRLSIGPVRLSNAAYYRGHTRAAPAPWPLQDRIAGEPMCCCAAGLCGDRSGGIGLEEDRAPNQVWRDGGPGRARGCEAALLQAKAIVQAERPWILIHVAPSPTIENGFTVIATNRGRSRRA